MKIKISTIWLFLILLRIPVSAQQISNCQASPYPITVKQADGSSLTIIGKGNLLNSWTETVDGYTLVHKNGNYEYANKVKGKLVPTGIVARNAGDRKPADAAFLQKVVKSIKPDAPAKANTPAFFESKQTISGPQKAGFPVTGQRKALLILIQYPDLPNTYNHFFFENLMNHPQFKGIGSFRDFYYSSSVGSLLVDTDVVGWYTAGHNYEYYGRQNGDQRATALIREAVDAAQLAGVDFSKYDNDKDGNVDGIMVAHAGPGAEEGSQLQYIWSHRWVLSAGNNQVKYDGVWIDDYIINPERRIYTNDIVGRGIFCHEFGHLLGLPDLYDIDGSSEGLGEWSLMAGAAWLGDEHTPGNFCAWSRTTLGWMTPWEISRPGNYSLYFGSIGYKIPTALPNEYFLIENRQKLNLDVGLRGSGLAIYHVNSNLSGQSGNANENMKMVDLEEADGRNDLDNRINRGDAGDLFPGSGNKTAFNDATYPNSRTYTNASTGINIHGISVFEPGSPSQYKALFTVGDVLSSGGYDFPLSYPYCSTNDYINNFSLNTLVNNSSGCNGLANNYINHEPTGSKTTQVHRGQTYTISLQSGPRPQGFGVWIDYNENKVFDDPEEFVYSSAVAGTGVFTGTITIPQNISTGIKRLRVRSVYDYVPTALEANKIFAASGETEDYTIEIDYCVPVYAHSCSSGDYIDDFSFNTLVHENHGCYDYPRNYSNLTPFFYTTSVNLGQSYPISLQSGPKAQNFGVWIDYNNDQDFDDAGEFVYRSPASGTGVFKGTITIPVNISPGQKRLRVRSRNGAVMTKEQSCYPFEYGETQDYTITIKDGEVSLTKWNKRFGGSGADVFSRMIRTADFGYLLAGHSSSPTSGDKSQGTQGRKDFWLVKTDGDGNKLWDKRYGGQEDDFLNALIATNDGGYLLGGNSLSGKSGDKSQASRGGKDYWVVKINANGVKQWDKRFGGTGEDDLRALVQLPSGDYMLAGYSASGTSGDKTEASRGGSDYWVVKINSAGTKLWDKRFGGSGEDWLEATLLNTDGSMLLGGRSASGQNGDKSQASRGGRDYWLVKINANGVKQWDKRYGGSGDDDLQALTRTSEGNYLLGGTSASAANGDKSQGSRGENDFWIITINNSGAKLWDKRFGGSASDELQTLIATADGGYLLGGRSDSGINGDKTQSSRGDYDFWMVKTTSTGTKQWDQRFGGNAEEDLRTLLEEDIRSGLPNVYGNYVLAGRSKSGVSGEKTQPSQGLVDYWLVKVSSFGAAIVPTTTASIQEEPKQDLLIKQAPEKEVFRLETFPNPFSNKLTIRFHPLKTESVTVKVYNSQGVEVKVLWKGQVEAGKKMELIWPVTSEKADLYVVRLVSPSTTAYQKVILRK
ncbi:hypothetical protein AHMF7605_05740 [Adhaeribacter arboris]|uniref:Uncharacterized protein n=1 Tax=Adhaeribacter arboris TaxID=2072846 RepID=A0A2T2YC13_9BACT|nr:M6 family metalloprotease domain-containing protein [Adhaeribacter arboris]PSR53062.1 hypothetical protein AHMF7605_05740 [Adhaeribacter arboris]